MVQIGIDSVLPTVDEIDALFFDFDGVIVDSLDIKADAFLSLFRDASESIRKRIHSHFYRYTGRSRQEKIAYVLESILGRPADERDIAELAEQFRSACFESVVHCAPISGSLELLDSIPARLKCFVVSGTPEPELVEIVRARHLAPYFSAVRGTPIRKEENIEYLLREHHLSAERCLMIGDGKVDQVAAIHNNMKFVGVVAETRNSPFSTDTPVVRDLNGLMKLLDGGAVPNE